MTIHEALFSPTRRILMAVCFLLLTGWIALISASFRSGRKPGIRMPHLLFLMSGFLFFYFPMLDIAQVINDPEAKEAVSPVLAALRRLPLAVMILWEAVSFLCLMAAFRGLLRRRKTHPTLESVKETMDLLPVGVAFGRADGTVAFSNLAMNALSRAVTGKELSDLNVFRKAVSPREEGRLALPDSVWRVHVRTADADGETFTQMTAAEFTAEAAFTRELEEKNKKLRDIRARLFLNSRQADRNVAAQELLTARIAVHSEVGSVLLESRHYLNDPSSYDEEKLLQALKNTNAYLLRDWEMDDTVRDPLSAALEKAEAMGVDVSIRGVIPAEEPCRRILSAAVGECASNAVKHAGGNRLDAELRSTGTENILILRTNGKPPRGTVRESGGLLSLRALVEKENGTMTVSPSPEFTLTVILPSHCSLGEQ